MLYILVYAVEVIHSPCILGRGVEHVDAEGEVRLRIVEHAHDGGQDVDLLSDLVLDLRLLVGDTWLVEDNGRAETADVRLVIWMVGEVGVVAGEHEDCVAEPRLAPGIPEELAESHICIADALMDLDALFGEAVLVLLRHLVWMVAAGREDGGHERLAHLRHLCGVVLQERLVPDGPRAVEILVAIEALVVVEVLTPVILLEACGACKRLEPHGAALGTVEEGRLIALGCE